MSKIEVRRVPDKRISAYNAGLCCEGTLVFVMNGAEVYTIDPEWHPALLAALLEGAGAVRTDAAGVIASARVSAFGSRFWILPVPEDTP